MSKRKKGMNNEKEHELDLGKAGLAGWEAEWLKVDFDGDSCFEKTFTGVCGSKAGVSRDNTRMVGVTGV